MLNPDSRRPSLRLNNTLTRTKELFSPREDNSVKMFTCGPSVYRRPHLGNYRTFLFEDVLQRYLEYLGYRVHRVINFTDVEDKAIAEAKEKSLSVRELVDPVEEKFFEESSRLRIQLPGLIHRASTNVQEAARLVQRLMDEGYAYRHQGDIFFDPLKFEGFGKLFGLDMSRWPKKKVRFRKDTYPGQRWNLGDFILWHGSAKVGEPAWDTSIGRGRPSWNIQDPAIIAEYLGFEIDVACGGVDNLFRHHDYTIAVMEALSKRTFSRFWLHGEHLLVDGAKMSKSKGNIVYIEDFTKNGYRPEHLRFFLIYGHYRSRKNLTGKGLEGAAKKLDDFRGLVDILSAGIEEPDSLPEETTCPEATSLLDVFENAMNDDLDVRGAFDGLLEEVSGLADAARRGALEPVRRRLVLGSLRRIDQVLGVVFPSEK